ncbi:hypothetical protein DXG01_001449, partial [Tephrocybe rancida]
VPNHGPRGVVEPPSDTHPRNPDAVVLIISLAFVRISEISQIPLHFKKVTRIGHIEILDELFYCVDASTTTIPPSPSIYASRGA